MELWIVIAMLLIALVTTLLVLVRQIRLQRTAPFTRTYSTFGEPVMPPIVRLTLLLLLILLVGCDDREQQLRTWQQEQVTQTQRHAQENAATTHALVAAEAESRRQFLELEQDLQNQRNVLEQDRQAVATAHERVPLLAVALQGTGAVLLGDSRARRDRLSAGAGHNVTTGPSNWRGALMELSSESMLFQQLPPALPGPTPIAAYTAADDVASSDPSTINPSGDIACRTL